MRDFPVERLRRYPDIEADNLNAWDATDRYLLDETRVTRAALGPHEIVVVGDRYGALSLEAVHDGARGVRVHQDGLSGERALLLNAPRVGVDPTQVTQLPLGDKQAGKKLFDGAKLVLLQLPRSLDALDEISQNIARFAPEARLYAGGRVKHMTLSMNEVLRRYFSEVVPGRARQKSRLLVASGSAGGEADLTYPHEARDAELGIEVFAHGAAFGGTRVDPGTRFLLKAMDGARSAARGLGGVREAAPTRNGVGTAGETLGSGPRIIDLGCGTGVIASVLARRFPEAFVIAADQSTAAVLSARETVIRNRVAARVEVVRDDGLDSQPSGSADLIALNPPFHTGATVHTGIALKLFDHAARVLRSGGELWTVYNSHLRYRDALERIVGPTGQAARNERFTVTVSRREV
ncbi:methyltransferase [Lysinibacter sp. HNR]|uniref:class I SAM-dependent methyltransferase n=1 Tax=Lysinibacter sp. HNR TaxID=3031408 RepID=UPI0024351EC0|nr:methyltransferase [Lysinibacter sp. HNR]WGD37256.1 methyltransferase [Lysinibacter sp. HNR]